MGCEGLLHLSGQLILHLNYYSRPYPFPFSFQHPHFSPYSHRMVSRPTFRGIKAIICQLRHLPNIKYTTLPLCTSSCLSELTLSCVLYPISLHLLQESYTISYYFVILYTFHPFNWIFPTDFHIFSACLIRTTEIFTWPHFPLQLLSSLLPFFPTVTKKSCLSSLFLFPLLHHSLNSLQFESHPSHSTKSNLLSPVNLHLNPAQFSFLLFDLWVPSDIVDHSLLHEIFSCPGFP